MRGPNKRTAENGGERRRMAETENGGERRRMAENGAENGGE